jgi:hypothetical protein
MRMAVASWLVCLTITGLAAPSLAQTTDHKALPEVVVEGRRDHQDAAHRFVNEITVEKEDQVAQFGEPICPLTLGLSAGYNGVITQRVLKDAKSAGVRIAGGRCEPNVIIMISDDGHQLLDRLHTDRGPLFEAMPLHDLHALLDEPGPVHAWQGVELLDNGGFPVGVRDPNGIHGPGPLSDAPVAKGYMPSRLQQAFRRRIDTAFVVIDAKAIDGLTLMQVADYAAMRTLAITRDPKGASMAQDSILALFDGKSGSPKPVSLSRSDAAYLHALYATSSATLASAQKASMAESINRTLSSATPGDK